ncbi:MAG TPA: NADH-quinone oxidoreductase subunit M [Candidatus Dormibacteraeota bacterium]|nr:NADH-quinone oxidoreductase subunit M [Candidatus Dormibacteraeota bacterium]
MIWLAHAPILASPTPVAVPGANIFTSPVLLSLTIWVPVVVAAAIAAMPNPRGRYDVLMKQIAFFTNLGIMFILFIAYNQFEAFLPTAQFEEKIPWLQAIGVTYHLGVDGPGMVMLLLSGVIGIASVLASLGIRERVRAYFSLLLLAQASVNGAIVARDMFVLILFWAAATIPLALLILGWGGPRRVSATWRLVGYWGLGTGALVLGTTMLYAATGGSSFDMDVLLKASLAPRVQLGIALFMIVAAATRLPIFPLHGWMRDVAAEAPPGVAVVVAGAASRLGAYLLVRTVIAAEPVAGHMLSPLVAALAALTVGYAAIAALRAVDVRHAAGYLAMIPGGITVLGLAAVSPLSIAGSVLSLFAGGVAAALVVGALGTLSERAQSRSLQVLGGLAPRMPVLSWILILAAMGVLGVPILATFPAEVMTFFGAFKNQPIGAFAVVAGLAVAAVALGIILRKVLFGAPNPDAPGVSDASLGEMWYLGVLAGALLWVGVFPAGPKIPGLDQPFLDPGIVNVMGAGLSDLASPYTAPTVAR